MDLANADARVIVDAVSAKLEDAPISPQEKAPLPHVAVGQESKWVALVNGTKDQKPAVHILVA